MKLTPFLNYITEVAADYYAIKQSGIDSIGLPQSQRLDDINSDLSKVIRKEELTPYVALDRIRRCLALWKFQFPQANLLNRREGVVVFQVAEFGKVHGVNIDGSPAVFSGKYDRFLWFEYAMNDDGYFNVAAVLVNKDELERLMSQEENESAEEDDEEHEAGSEFEKLKLQDEEVVSEEVISELSKKTLDSYITKAGDSMNQHSKAYHKEMRKTTNRDTAKADHHLTKSMHRSGGQIRAINKYAHAKEEVVNEKLDKDANSSQYIDDFVHSKNKRFKGKSKAERIKMALGASYHNKH